MQQNYIIKAFVIALFLASINVMQAQNSWAMATIEDGKLMPSFSEFSCMSEKGANGIEYLRIYDMGYRIRQEYYNPVKLQYGYRLADKQIFIYDFETNEERQAFDFTLSAGDHFCTYNGMEWEVETVIDTLVNISYQGLGESSTKRLLKVVSVDGRYSDQWLEDFGSFANHFMILPMNEVGQTQTLWMEYDYGHYLVREISSDPIYTHDSGTPDENENGPESLNVTYNNGSLRVEKMGWHSPNREYICFCRVGDDLYNAYVWELSPATVAAYVVWHKDIAYFYGLPAPQCGNYTMHFNQGDKPSGIIDITNATINNQTESSIHDLQGRQLPGKPARGIYIEGGKKVMR